MKSSVPASSCRRASFSQLFQKFVQSPHFPTFIRKFLKIFAPRLLKTYIFSIRIRSLSLKLMFTGERHLICYQATRVRYLHHK